MFPATHVHKAWCFTLAFASLLAAGQVNAFDYRYVNDTHEGSLSYSVTVGQVRIIQLNNEPTYER
ncbi:hypothetical protein [Pantoea sp. Cy-639]|uniref:hypothetical protein n=1 Tax=Pantoea sp. Cy-639 TaxID=2608360 RepID=UPI00141FAEA7|nr:hypothetical protein [Pantoea sp. Cy-639]NIF17336.1 hypothetical protein [Pantoea sp. Cy-639]